MRHVKDILRLKFQNGLSVREIARSCGVPNSTVGDYIERAEAAGLGWPLPEDLSDSQLKARLMEGPSPSGRGQTLKPLPNWPVIRQELGRKGVTLRLLWEEYRREHPEGYQYSRFCELYERWANTLDPVLRQTHEPGAKLFVDWAGKKVRIHCAEGATIEASLFIAVAGASNKIYVEAFENEQAANWIRAHCRAFEFFGGVSRAVVPDNTKTAVKHACRYEPVLDRTYKEMANHYGTVILPARVRRPQDKAKAEAGVLLAERQILARLRNLCFFSLAQLNAEIGRLLRDLNARPFQKLEGSRNSWFESLEKPALLPLPSQPFEMASWSKAKANIDYHVAVDHHFYSVPYQFAQRQVEARLTAHTVEIFLDGKRIAAHSRSHQRGKFTTRPEHRPKTHQQYLDWTPSRLISWAAKTGPQCARVAERILNNRLHPEQGYRSCLGLMRLGKAFGQERLEAACRRALLWDTCSYRSIKSILENSLDRQAEEPSGPCPSPAHANVRGQEYYNG